MQGAGEGVRLRSPLPAALSVDPGRGRRASGRDRRCSAWRPPARSARAREQRCALGLPGAARHCRCRSRGVADLSRAKPLFYSRKSSKLEDFVYVPDSVIVSPERRSSQAIIPAFRSRRPGSGDGPQELPLVEVDVLVDRSRLQPIRRAALAQTKAVARSVEQRRARAGPPDRQHLQHAAGRARRRGRWASGCSCSWVCRACCWRRSSPPMPAASWPARSGGSERTCASAAPTAANCCECSPTERWRSPAPVRIVGTALGLLSVMVDPRPRPLLEAATRPCSRSALRSPRRRDDVDRARPVPPRPRGRWGARSAGERAEMARTRTPRWRRCGSTSRCSPRRRSPRRSRQRRGLRRPLRARCTRAGRCPCPPTC